MVSPRFAQLDDATVEVDVRNTPDGVDVTVLLLRTPSPAIEGTSLDVELIDRDGVPATAVERPIGTLVEVGGSLTRTASGTFRFAASRPGAVIVRWHGESARFEVTNG